MNGISVVLPSSDLTWLVTSTVDGALWDTVMFEDINDARTFAADLINDNAGNERFAICFKRTVVCDTYEFLDECVEGGMVHVVAPSAR